ncbi:MAG: phage minor capsid protein, partial [Oscillospiraceae bacterium]
MTQEEISYLGDLTSELLQPTKDFLLKEICRRVAKAGKMTSTAEYQAYRAKALGIEWGDIQKELKRQGTVSNSVIDNIFGKLSQDAIGIEDNESLLKMLKAYKNTVKSDFKSISKEMGIVAPDGKQYPIFDTVVKTMDYAFKQVFTGSQDYTSALRAATRAFVNKGIRTMPRQNAKSVTIEYAARQRLMNSLGLMNEAIIESNYNELGCDGWEISAHGGSAPDHEPIQGHQYSNADYKALNANLQRRIGTLSCKHTASPIILGVNSPQYTNAELKAFQTENAKGITYQGRHYTLYEATQQQRSCEASIRRQKYHCLADAELGDKEKLLTDQIRLNITREQYLRFSRASGLPTQNERAQVAGFGRSEASKASAAYRKNTANNKAYSDREFSIKAVTEESIEAVPKISGSAFTTEQIDNLQSANRAVLRA